MSTTKADRRIIRTRQLLRASLLALIRERGFDLLTVQDITDRAGLNRATFYLHYADKHDLLAQMIRETLEELSGLRVPINAQRPDEVDIDRVRMYFVSIFQHVINNAEFYRVMISSNVAGLSNEIYDGVFRTGLRILSRVGIKTWRVPPDVMMNTLSGAYLGMVRWTVNQPTPPTAELTAARFMELILPGILSAMGQ